MGRANASRRKDQAKSLSLLLRQMREEAGESQKKAGPKLGVTYSYLSKLENGVVEPSEELLNRIVRLYGGKGDPLYAAARRLPPDVISIFEAHFEEAVDLVRRRFKSDSRLG